MTSRKSKSRPKRSRRGEAQPFQRESDGRWTVTIELPRDNGGKRRRLPIYGQSAAEVEAKRSEALAEIEAEAALAVQFDDAAKFSAATSVGDWCSEWLLRKHPVWADDGRRTGIKHSSWRGYEQKIRLYVLSQPIAKIPLGELRRKDVQNWKRDLPSLARRATLAPRTVEYAVATLRAALQEAVDDEHITENPARRIKVTKETEFEGVSLSLVEARALLRALRGHQDEALILVSLFRGSRQGETLSLRWSDVDLTAGTLTIEETLDWIAGGAVIEENKTRASRRKVVVPPYVVEALRTHRQRQIDERDRAAARGRPLPDYDLVFTGESGQALRGSTVAHRFKDLLRAHNLPNIRWHDMRHTAITLMPELGVPMHVVQKIVGHASLKMMSERYAHVTPQAAAASSAPYIEALEAGVHTR